MPGKPEDPGFAIPGQRLPAPPRLGARGRSGRGVRGAAGRGLDCAQGKPGRGGHRALWAARRLKGAGPGLRAWEAGTAWVCVGETRNLRAPCSMGCVAP